MIRRHHVSHRRSFVAHWPKPLTASEATISRPSCLSSPANQLTWVGNRCRNRPIESPARYASVPSQIGGVIPPQAAAVLLRRWPSPTPTDHPPFPLNPISAPRHRSLPYSINSVRRLNVTRDSDFRTKSQIGKNSVFPSGPSGVRRPSERISNIRQISFEPHNA